MIDAVAAAWEALVQWWNSVELWLTQQWLPVQVGLLMLVLLPLCWWLARGIDRAVEALGQRGAGGAQPEDEDPG